jgi:hypothetical protein
MRIFKTRAFTKLMAKAGITNQAFCKAIQELKQGLHDGHLGKKVYKKRIAISGKGKRAGGRTIIATNLSSKWFFIYGFKKNQATNIDSKELEALQMLANDLLELDTKQLKIMIEDKQLEEVNCG